MECLILHSGELHLDERIHVALEYRIIFLTTMLCCDAAGFLTESLDLKRLQLLTKVHTLVQALSCLETQKLVKVAKRRIS